MVTPAPPRYLTCAGVRMHQRESEQPREQPATLGAAAGDVAAHHSKQQAAQRKEPTTSYSAYVGLADQLVCSAAGHHVDVAELDHLVAHIELSDVDLAQPRRPVDHCELHRAT